jgi:Flp pilus assembly protein TadD
MWAKDAANKCSEGRRLPRTGNYRAAIHEFSAAITLEPDHWTAYFHRSEAYRNLRMEEQAAADLARAEFLMRLVRQEAAEAGLLQMVP